MNNKPTYNPQIHHRRSIRLKGYDYSQQGLYFVTICAKNRACLFGEIINQQMILNDAGIMVNKWYSELENKYPDINCLEHIVMPNHFHCIVENTGVGETLRIYSDNVSTPDNDTSPPIKEEGEHTGSPLQTAGQPILDEPIFGEYTGSPPQTAGQPILDEPIFGEHTGSPLQTPGQPIFDEPTFGEHSGSPLWRVIQWFKTMSTNEYIRNVKSNNWPRFDGKLWQRNYWEHVIRDEKSYHTISEYIINNPKNWDNDSINPKNEKNK